MAAWASAAEAQLPRERTDTATGRIAGTVRGRFQGEIEVLPWSLVEAWSPGVRRSDVADSLGHYHLDGLPQGLVHVKVSHVGHAAVSLDVLVAAGGTVPLDVELAARPMVLPPLEVVRDRRVPETTGQPADGRALARVDAAAIESGAGVADAGLVDAVRSLTGNDPADPKDVLFMRGTTTDLKLVLLDGAPVYAPFHVAGLLRSFDPAVLSSAELHVGGAPARYDGGLTYILDLTTRSPRRDRLRGTGSVDLISATGELDGPLGPHAGFVASARGLHDLGSGILGGSSPYGYHDVLLSTEADLAPGHTIRATGFWNRESVALDLARTQGVPEAYAPPSAWWANRAASARYHGHAGSALLDLTAATSGYRASLPLQPTPTQTDPDPTLLLATGAVDRVRLVGEVALPTQKGTVRAGLSYEALDVAYRAGPVVGSTASSVTTSGNGTVAGGYLDVTRVLGPDVTMRAGLRADAFAGDDQTVRLAPRASIAWTVAPDAVVTVAAGRYHQHARATDAALEGAIGSVVQSRPTGSELLPVASADHVVLSLDQTLGRQVRLGIDGFWKRYSGLSAADGETVRNSGLDLRIRREGEATTAWLGYGLSWFWSTSDLSGPTSSFVGRQLLSAGLSGTLKGPIGGEVRVAYGAGLPYTAVPFSAGAAPTSFNQTQDVANQSPPLSGGPDEEFLRVDVELHATLKADWAGRPWRFTPYLRILNALDSRDALFYTLAPYRDESPHALAAQALIPVLGVSWRF
jgi:hypothetical protein